jgi:hypothetical protein
LLFIDIAPKLIHFERLAVKTSHALIGEFLCWLKDFHWTSFDRGPRRRIMSITCLGVIGSAFTGLPVTATQRGKRWVAMKLKGAPGGAPTHISPISNRVLLP